MNEAFLGGQDGVLFACHPPPWHDDIHYLCNREQLKKAQHLSFEDDLQGLKFVYNKGESQLRITGMFNMFLRAPHSSVMRLSGAS